MENCIRSPPPTTRRRPYMAPQARYLDARDAIERELSGASSVNVRLALPEDDWLPGVPCQRLVRHAPGVIHVYPA